MRLVGGRLLRDWRPVTDPAVLDRLPVAARDKVVCCDLLEQGVQDLGAVQPGRNWGESEASLELFFQDRPMTLARYPNEGFLEITDVLGSIPVEIYGVKGCRDGIFTYDDARPERWDQDTHIMVHGFWAYDWADQRLRVASIDPAQRLVTIAPPNSQTAYRKGQWFYFYNLLSEIDQPDEWWLDRETGMLYFWPPAHTASGHATVSVLPELVTMDAVSHVTFQGLIFECARETAVKVTGGTGVRLAGCTLRNVGGWAVQVNGGADHGIIGCDVYHTGSGGVMVNGGDRKTLTAGGHRVENCHIHHFGRWNPMYKPAVSLDGVGNRVSHCLIHDGPHSAILFKGNDHVMEYNEIHSVVYHANDAGAIYAYHDWTFRGQVIRHNYFHHLYGYRGRGCCAVFLDNVISGTTIVGNVFQEVRSKHPGAVFVSGGRDNTIANNVFANCGQAVYITSCIAWPASLKPLSEKLQALPYTEEPWRSRYPQLLNLLEDEPDLAKGNVVARNICRGGKWLALLKKADLGTTVEDNLTEQDPHFVNEQGSDFRLRPDSPAWGLGFQRIPFEQIGLYDDPLRASWPVTHSVRPAPPEPAAPQAKPHPTARFTVPAVTAPVTVDGNVSPGEWPQGMMTMAETPSRVPIRGLPASARVCHDGAVLYVAVTVPVTGAAAVNLEPRWGQGDGVEVVFRDAASALPEPAPTYAVQGYANGECTCIMDAGDGIQPAKTLAAAVRFAATVADRQWTGEWALPLAAVGVQAVGGGKLDFNLGAFRSSTKEWIIWAGALGSTMRLDNGGTLVLQ